MCLQLHDLHMKQLPLTTPDEGWGSWETMLPKLLLTWTSWNSTLGRCLKGWRCHHGKRQVLSWVQGKTKQNISVEKKIVLRCVRTQTRTLSYEIWIDCFRVYVKCELLWAKEVLLKAGYFPLLMFWCPWNQFWGTNIREHVLNPGFVVAVSSPASGLPESIGISPKET